MATLLIDQVNDQIPAMYQAASEPEKQQIRQVIEDIFQLFTGRQSARATSDQLRSQTIAFARNHRTFPRDSENFGTIRRESHVTCFTLYE